MLRSPFLIFDGGGIAYAGDCSVAIAVPVSSLDTFLIVHNVPYRRYQ